MKSKSLLLLLALATLGLSACNTVRGAGQDIQRAGVELQQEAVEHSN